MRSTLPLLFLTAALIFANCNKKCRSLQSDVGGGIIKSYDFKGCLIYANLDSNITIRNQSEFNAYKSAKLKSCDDTSKLDAIDFNQHMLVGQPVKVYACNVAMHRRLAVDTVAKTYTYTIKTELCEGCNTELVSPNWVIMPQLPAGYNMVYKIEKQ
jgi:uncharacterized protein YlaI